MQKRNQFYHLRSHLAFPRGRVMIFILFFEMTMRAFAQASVGSLRERLFGLFRIYYAMTTQKSFFWSKKRVFFSCHASDFLLRKTDFYGFWAFIFCVELHGKKRVFLDSPKTKKIPCKSDDFYKLANSLYTQCMERDDFWTIFPFFEPLFYMTFITINPVSIFNRCMGPFLGDHF